MKIIGIDLDDVLLSFNSAFVEFHNSNYGTSHKREEITTYFMEEIWGVTSEEIYKRLNEFYYSEGHKNASPIEGAIEAIAELAKDNELHIITASPENIKVQISAWLDKHFGAHFKHVHFTRKTIFDKNKKNKRDICRELGIELFIDDSIHNSEDIASLNVPVLLLDSPWNQGNVTPPIKRVYSWKEIMSEIKSDSLNIV